MPQAVDWSGCDLVEVIPGKVSGQPLIKNTRLPVQALIENHDDGLTPAEIVEQFPGVTEEQVRQVVEYARQHDAKPKRPRVSSPARS